MLPPYNYRNCKMKQIPIHRWDNMTLFSLPTKPFIMLCAAIFAFFILNGCGGSGGGGGTVIQAACTLPSPPQIPAELPMLTIRLEYNDAFFTSPASIWSDKLFGSAFHQLNNYFDEASRGMFSLQKAVESEGTSNDGIITVHLNKNHPDSGFLDTIHPDLKAALIAADGDINFAPYDTDGNSHITPDEMALIFIVAGYEEAYDIGSPSVWAHTYCTETVNTPTLDGVSLMGCDSYGTYGLFGELHGTGIDEHDATIGIIAHELAHAVFELPDLYNTDTGDAGIGDFGMMGHGGWGEQNATDNAGNTPVHFSAWSKQRNGWGSVRTLSQEINININLNESSSAFYNMVKLPVDSSEYFLLENRNNSGYDRGLSVLSGVFNGGVAVWHVDENVICNNFYANTVQTDTLHPGIDLEEANTALTNHENNLYYQGNTTAFTPTSPSNSNDYSNAYTGIFVNSISPRGAAMSATVTNPN